MCVSVRERDSVEIVPESGTTEIKVLAAVPFNARVSLQHPVRRENLQLPSRGCWLKGSYVNDTSNEFSRMGKTLGGR